MKNILEELEKSILEKPSDLAMDYLEIGLDEITNSEIIKNIPVIKTFVSLFQTGMSIKERHFAKKLMVFAAHLYNNNVSACELDKRKNAIRNNEKWIKKEIEQIIVFLDRFDFEYKAKILAKLYIAFINNIICSNIYINMLQIIDKWHKRDEELLKIIYDLDNRQELNLCDSDRASVYLIDLASRQRLEALGILGITYEVKDISYLLDETDTGDACPYALIEKKCLNPEGRILAEILFEGSVLTHFKSNDISFSSI